MRGRADAPASNNRQWQIIIWLIRAELTTMSKYQGSPAINGNIEISKRRGSVFIGGDPEGLRSLAKLLYWLADADQEVHPTMPDGEREHVHLYAHGADAFGKLSPFSVTTEICRLDAKGTGNFPDKYYDDLEKHRQWRQLVRRRCHGMVKVKRI